MFLPRIVGMLAAVWGVGGAITLLGFAVARMLSHCIDAINYPLNASHWVVLVAWTFFMAYSEGYRGFQRGYSPRVAARALYLRDHSTLLRLALAPLFCMGFFHAPLRRRITVIVLVIVISLLVVLFRQLPQPWRGVLDFGVVVGLTWGIVATLIYFFKYIHVKDVPINAEVVEQTGTVEARTEKICTANSGK